MGNKYMKKCSVYLAKKEMQIKTTLRFYLTPVRMVVIENTNKYGNVTMKPPPYS
jgi:hypothetical protein